MNILFILTCKIKATGGDLVVKGNSGTESFREKREERRKEIGRGRRDKTENEVEGKWNRST